MVPWAILLLEWHRTDGSAIAFDIRKGESLSTSRTALYCQLRKVVEKGGEGEEGGQPLRLLTTVAAVSSLSFSRVAILVGSSLSL